MDLIAEMVGLAEAAVRLRIPYQNAHRLLLTGSLSGEKRSGRWFVSVADVERIVAERQTGLTVHRVTARGTKAG
jgi:hypothetical protein